MTPRICFTDGYRYRLEADYYINVGIYPDRAVGNRYLRLLPSGDLRIAEGYCWDGATNAPEWLCARRPSLVHDAIYQLIGLGLLSPECRDDADALFRRLCTEDGMSGWMAKVWHAAVQRFGPKGGSAPKELQYAPKQDRAA